MRENRFDLSKKASDGLIEDRFSIEDLTHAILNGQVSKKIKDPLGQAKFVYVMIGRALNGRSLYSQGKVVTGETRERRFFIITAHEAEG